MHKLIKIYHVVQEFYFHWLLTDGHTGSHSGYIAHLRVVQFYLYWRDLKTQHLDSSFNLCLKRMQSTNQFDCMLKSESYHLILTHEKLVHFNLI